MKKITGIAVVVCAVVLVASPSLAGGKEWKVPTCSSIKGLPSVSFTTDGGASWAPADGFLPLGQGTFGIATLDAQPNTMLAEYRGTIWRSTNGGCTWRSYAPVGVSPLEMAEAGGTVAYAWSLFAAPHVWRLDAKASPRKRLVRGSDLPGADVLVVQGDPANPDRVRVVGDNGQIFESLDGGVSKWGLIGSRAPVSPLTYFAAIDPANLDHVVIGSATSGVWTTFDGGTSWTQAAGLSITGGPRNSFNGVISAANGNVVYVNSIDLDEAASGAPSNGRHMYRSDDGGLSFTTVVDQGGGIVLTNGPTMATDPANDGLLYFSFGSRTQLGGVNLYRYDHSTGQTTTTFSSDFFEIRAFDFNPADSGVLYGGFEGE